MKKTLLVIFAACLAITASLFYPAYADEDPICDQLRNMPDFSTSTALQDQYAAAGCDNTGDPATEAFSTIRNVLNAVYVAVGIAAVGVIIFGGFRYTLSQGDPGKVKKAKDTIMYAIIGLIVVLSAFAITNFILGIL